MMKLVYLTEAETYEMINDRLTEALNHFESGVICQLFCQKLTNDK